MSIKIRRKVGPSDLTNKVFSVALMIFVILIVFVIFASAVWLYCVFAQDVLSHVEGTPEFKMWAEIFVYFSLAGALVYICLVTFILGTK